MQQGDRVAVQPGAFDTDGRPIEAGLVGVVIGWQGTAHAVVKFSDEERSLAVPVNHLRQVSYSTWKAGSGRSRLR